MKALLCGKSFLFKRVSLKQWLLLNFWFAIKKLCNIITVFVISTAVSTYTHEDLLKTLNLDVAIPNPFSTVPSPHKSIVKKIRYANSKALRENGFKRLQRNGKASSPTKT